MKSDSDKLAEMFTKEFSDLMDKYAKYDAFKHNHMEILTASAVYWGQAHNMDWKKICHIIDNTMCHELNIKDSFNVKLKGSIIGDKNEPGGLKTDTLLLVPIKPKFIGSIIGMAAKNKPDVRDILDAAGDPYKLMGSPDSIRHTDDETELNYRKRKSDLEKLGDIAAWFLEHLKRLEKLDDTDSLELQLKEAIIKEDYEKAAELKRKIEQKK